LQHQCWQKQDVGIDPGVEGCKHEASLVFSHKFFSHQWQTVYGYCVCMGERGHVVGCEWLGLQESEIWWDQQVLCPVPHLQAAGFAVTVCSRRENSHFHVSIPDYKSLC